MSTQGTLSGISSGYERQLLEDWGMWARSGVGMGYSSAYWLKKSGLRLVFSEEEILRADRAIAGLGRFHRRILCRVYLHQKRGVKGVDLERAITAFSDALSENEKDLLL